jgi:hypothetical protein
MSQPPLDYRTPTTAGPKRRPSPAIIVAIIVLSAAVVAGGIRCVYVFRAGMKTVHAIQADP